MIVFDLILADELFLMDLRVSLFDVVSKEVFGWTCSIKRSTMPAFAMWKLSISFWFFLFSSFLVSEKSDWREGRHMGTFLPMFVATKPRIGFTSNVKGKLVWHSRRKVGLYWAYLFSDRFFETQMYKIPTRCCRGYSLTANLIPDSGGLVDILQ